MLPASTWLRVVSMLLWLWLLGCSQGTPRMPRTIRGPYTERMVSIVPRPFEARSVRFHLFTKSNASDFRGTIVFPDTSSLLAAGWNPHLQTRIIIHGFNNDVTSLVNQLIKNAYLSTGQYNVLCVDWSPMSAMPWYGNAAENVAPTAQLVANLTELLLEQRLAGPSQLHLIGHSLGAHVAGLAAGALSQRPLRVTGLDPALPVIGSFPEERRLNSRAAEVVDVIHSNAGWYGIFDAVGTVDFYPNGGKTQPGCDLHNVVEACSHGRAYEYFAESIVQGRGFLSQRCATLQGAALGNCCHSGAAALMGDQLQFVQSGIYYLRTAASSPFNIGVNWKLRDQFYKSRSIFELGSK